MRKMMMLISFISVVTLLFSCQNQQGSNYTFPTGGTSGVLYSIGAAFSQTMNESDVPINLTNQVSGGAIENIRLMDRKEADFSLFGGDVALEAYEGKGMFKGNPQKDSLRSVFTIYSQPLGIVALESSDIQSIDDLKGKKIAVGTPGSGNEVRTKQVLNALDLYYGKDFKPQFLSISESVDGLKDGQLDAIFVWTGLPTPGIMDLANIRDIKMISLTDDEVNAIYSVYPSLHPFKIPAKTYKGVNNDIQTISVDVSLFVNKDVPEDDVYQLTKTVFDHLDNLQGTVSTLRQLNKETAAKTLIELHPGAKKYFKEADVIN
ncbi:TAXI family TRAP transporter solute-binding subunit [Bacillus pumilus]|uniref:TAXI family TRAP transporter solute-binding subunit n=1 Tax=Bacillus pumilus TaxID=1408 RepID=UPI001C235706|nr:TAXI family TRAP transporter solute-binding subunit [Bacillus pumilus]MBU8657283.1 TAXI family TRAP transporter solute-binding subunit [Bacillus pumilus]